MRNQKTPTKVKTVVNLAKFEMSKKEGLQLEGGPELSRGTVTGPANGQG